jgi:hypothetical protein
MTRQEVDLFINPLESIKQTDKNTMEVGYAEVPGRKFNGDWQQLIPARRKKSKKTGQLQLF